MDTFKDIKVKIDDTESALAALETALSVARKFTAHLDVFHIRPQPSCLVPVPVVSSDIAGFVVNEVVTADERAADEAADKTRAAFGEFVKNHGLCPTDEPRKNIGEVSAEYREFDGAEAEMTAWCARAADLMVLPRPAENNPDNALEIVNAAVMEGGSAVLLAPQTKNPSVGERVAILWDGSEEASKAVAYAMPFLVRAQEVVIIETEVPLEEIAGAAELAKRLAWHEIVAQVVKMPEISSVSERAAEVIKQTCAHYDMLVMGAYTQSSMRRWILGSFTKSLILNADIALLMSH